jgi:hypothetical protein
LKLLQYICREDETCANFFVDIAEAGSKMPPTPTVEVPKEEKEARHPGAMRADHRIIKPPRIPPNGK